MRELTSEQARRIHKTLCRCAVFMADGRVPNPADLMKELRTALIEQTRAVNEATASDCLEASRRTAR